MGLIAGTHILRKINRASRRIVTSLCFVSLILGTAHAAQLTATWVDNSDNEKDFKLERKTGTTGKYQLLASVPADTPFYVDTTVTAGTTYCYRVRAKNDAGESANSNEACAVAANTPLQPLTVAKAGTGTGTVASSPSGINCGATCSASFTSGTSVGLSATAATGSTFTGWSGACTGTGGCAVVLDAAKSVTATFAAGAQATTTLTMSSVTATQASPVVAGTAAHPHRHGDRGHRPLSVQVVGLERQRLDRRAGLGDRQHPPLDAAGPRQLRGPRLGPQ